MLCTIVGFLLCAATELNLQLGSSKDLAKHTFAIDGLEGHVFLAPGVGAYVGKERPIGGVDPSVSGVDFKEIVLFEGPIDAAQKDRYRITFTTAPSMDPTFGFYRLDADGKETEAGMIWGVNLAIPGDGTLWTSGHANNMFDAKRLFRIIDGKVQEVKQPFLAVGLKSTTRKPIILFADKAQKQSLGTVPEGSEIEVLLADADDEKLFLMKSNAGIVGWVTVPSDQEDTTIAGMFYKGD